MNPLLEIVVGLVLLFAIVNGWNMLLARPRKGRFDPKPGAGGELAFWSDFGLFEFDRAVSTLRMARNAGERTVPLASVASVRIAPDEEHAPWLEEFLHGLDVTDFLGHRDRITWHYVVLRLDTGEDIPVTRELERADMAAPDAQP